MKTFYVFKRARGEVHQWLLNTKNLQHRQCWELEIDDAKRVLYMCLSLFLHPCLGVHLGASRRGRFLVRWTFDVVQYDCYSVTILHIAEVSRYWAFLWGVLEMESAKIWSLHWDMLKVCYLYSDWLLWKSQALRRNSFDKDCIWGAESAWYGALGATGRRKGKMVFVQMIKSISGEWKILGFALLSSPSSIQEKKLM